MRWSIIYVLPKHLNKHSEFERQTDRERTKREINLVQESEGGDTATIEKQTDRDRQNHVLKATVSKRTLITL